MTFSERERETREKKKEKQKDEREKKEPKKRESRKNKRKNKERVKRKRESCPLLRSGRARVCARIYILYRGYPQEKGGGVVVNQKYEAFCVAFVNNGDNAAEAYRAAGYKARTQHSAEASASRLLKNAEVNARIAELKAKIRSVSDKKMVMDATAKREMLAGIMNNPNVSVSDRLKACDIDNKMAGEYVTKTQLSGADGGPIVYNVHWDGDADG